MTVCKNEHHKNKKLPKTLFGGFILLNYESNVVTKLLFSLQLRACRADWGKQPKIPSKYKWKNTIKQIF